MRLTSSTRSQLVELELQHVARRDRAVAEDDDVEPAELRDRVLEAALEVGPVAQVALQREGVEAVGPQRLGLALGAGR